jgi:hypothetical protein
VNRQAERQASVQESIAGIGDSDMQAAAAQHTKWFCVRQHLNLKVYLLPPVLTHADWQHQMLL